MEAQEDDRLEALQKWANRVMALPSKMSEEQRHFPRKALEEQITLLPLEMATLKPNPRRKIRAVTKDECVVGLGVISNMPIEGELFFAELFPSRGVLLLRKVRERHVHGSITEYGFQILDRFESFQAMRET